MCIRDRVTQNEAAKRRAAWPNDDDVSRAHAINRRRSYLVKVRAELAEQEITRYEPRLGADDTVGNPPVRKRDAPPRQMLQPEVRSTAFQFLGPGLRSNPHADLHLLAHGVEVDEPRLEDGASDRLKSVVHAAVELDLTVKGAEGCGDTTLLRQGRRANRHVADVVAVQRRLRAARVVAPKVD